MGEEHRGLFVLPMNYQERMTFIESEIIQIYQRERLDEDKKRVMLNLVKKAGICVRKRRTEELLCSGSVNSGFATNDSDLDIAVVLNTDWSNGSLEYALGELDTITNLLKSEDYYRGHEILRSARVPIAICKMEMDNYTFDVDLIPHPFGEHGLLNSKLLSLYGQVHPYVSILGVVIKCWAHARNINDTRKGDGLSSYTFIVMLVAFLQRIQPQSLLPYLQDCEPRQKVRGQYDFSFRTDIHEDVRNAESWSMPLAQVLLDFFLYYAQFDWENRKVDIKQPNDAKEEANRQMVIQDPFIRERNLADVLKKPGAVFTVKREFKRAYDVLLQPYSSLNDLLGI